MKRVLFLGGILMLGLLVGTWFGHSLCSAQQSYIRAYTSTNEAFILLSFLDAGQPQKIWEFERAELLGGLAEIDRLPKWTYRFNPADPDSPQSNEKIQNRINLALGGIDTETLADYGLTADTVKRIIDDHFSHYQTTRFRGDQIDSLLGR